MKHKKNKVRVALNEDASSQPLNTAFAGLAKKIESVLPSPPPRQPQTQITVEPIATQTPDAQLDAALCRLRRVHAFKSKKGRGGKTVTEIDHLQSIEGPLLALLCKRLCRRLGCGGTLEGTSIILQGDQTAAVTAYFAAARHD